MSGPATQALARALLGRARALLPRLPPAARATPLLALDRFCASPAPAAYVAAARALAAAQRDLLIERIAGSGLRRRFAAGLESLRACDAVDQTTVDRLAADLPIDARAGDRLAALAALAATWDELAGRVATETERMRQRLRDEARASGWRSRWRRARS